MIVANYDICMIGIVLTIISLAVSGCYVLAQRVKPFGICSDLILYRTDYQLITPPDYQQKIALSHIGLAFSVTNLSIIRQVCQWSLCLYSLLLCSIPKRPSVRWFRRWLYLHRT